MGQLDGITDSVDMNLSRLWEMVEDKGAWRAVVHGITKSWTWLSDRASMHWCPGQAMAAPCPVCFRELP